MLTQSVYLVGVWLALSLIMALLFGKRVHHSDFLTSMIYLILIVVTGDYLLLWLGIPVRTIYFASIIVVALGIPFNITYRDWNALGQTFFLFSIAASLTYLMYAFLVTAFSPVSPVAFIISFLLLFLEVCALTLSLTYAYALLDVLCRARWHRRPQVKTLGQ